MAELYAAEGNAIVIKGGHCSCGHTFFPFQRFGCERCGAIGEAVQPLDLVAHGELLASAEVHLKGATVMPTPYSIGAIRLQSGPVLRALLAPGASAAPRRVQAEISPLSAGEDPRFALHFVTSPRAADTQ